MEKKYVVQISNEFFSNGRKVARRLGEILGIPCYNEYIQEEAARRLDLSEEDVHKAEEKSPKLVADSFFPNKFLNLGERTTVQQDKIFQEQQKIILELAAQESCVIVGRCSDFALEFTPNVLFVFLYAPYEFRVRNCIDEMEIDSDMARAYVAKRDDQRNAYQMNYAGFEPSDHLHKDVMIDCSILGIEGTAQILATMVRQRFEL